MIVKNKFFRESTHNCAAIIKIALLWKNSEMTMWCFGTRSNCGDCYSMMENWYQCWNNRHRGRVTCEPIRATSHTALLCSLKRNMGRSDLPFPPDKYLLIRPWKTVRLRVVWATTSQGNHKTQSHHQWVWTLATEPGIVWGVKAGISDQKIFTFFLSIDRAEAKSIKDIIYQKWLSLCCNFPYLM